MYFTAILFTLRDVPYLRTVDAKWRAISAHVDYYLHHWKRGPLSRHCWHEVRQDCTLSTDRFKQGDFCYLHILYTLVGCWQLPSDVNSHGTISATWLKRKLYSYAKPDHLVSATQKVLAGSPSRGGDVSVYVFDISQPSLPTLFILFLCLFLSLWQFHLYFIP